VSNRKRTDEQGTLPDGWIEVPLDGHRIPARGYDTLTAFVLAGGWAVFRIHDRPGLPAVCHYVEQDDDRRPESWWYLAEVRYLTGGPYRIATDWAEFPIAQLDRLATTADFVEVLTATSKRPVSKLLDRATEIGRMPLLPLIPARFVENLPAVYAASNPRDRGVSFFMHIARAYEELITRGRRPAPEIADLLGVPSTTVHRWLREARALGYLAPARKDQPTRRGRNYVR
jgi:hypothetical protein